MDMQKKTLQQTLKDTTLAEKSVSSVHLLMENTFILKWYTAQVFQESLLMT